MKTACDTETEMVHSIHPEMQITDRPVPALCVMSWAVPGQTGLIHNSDTSLVPTVKRVLTRESIWANPVFDMAVLVEHEDSLLRPVFDAFEHGLIKDVLIRETLLDLASGRFNTWKIPKPHTQYSLGGVAFRRLGVNMDKGEQRKKYGELISIPLSEWSEEARIYPQNDTTATLAVYQDQENRRQEFQAEEECDPLQSEDHENRCNWALHLMGIHGIRVDQERVRAFSANVTRQWEEAKARLQKAGLVRSDGTRDTKAAEARMAACGGTRTTESGKALSLDAEACQDSGDELLVDYADYGSLLKLKSTYIAPMLEAGNLPIHPRWNPIVTTARTSCARPNLQQLPQVEGVRQCYCAAPGRILVDRDYGSAELVAFAQRCIELFGQSDMAEALKAGKSLHLMVAATLRNISYDEAVRLYAEDPASLHTERQLGKTANFGFLGGSGGETFAAATWRKTMKTDHPIRLTPQEASELKNTWKATWSDARQYLDEYVSRACSDDKACFRDPMSGLCVADRSYTQFANINFQARVAAMAKDAGWRITKRQYLCPDSALYGSHCVIFGHDQWVLECDKGREHAVADELGEVMLEAARYWIPDVPMTVGDAVIGTHWSK